MGPKSTSQIQSSNPEVPTVEVGDPDPALEISRILEAQARMQQEFAEYKKRNADEMEALREENSRLKQKIEADKVAGEPCPTHSRIDVPPTEDESEYKPTGPTTGGNYSSFASRRNRRHPFIDGITETPLPHKWKAPTITYDGTMDLDEFVSIYNNQVGMYSMDDAVLCKSFSVALRGSALEWFMSLPPTPSTPLPHSPLPSPPSSTQVAAMTSPRSPFSTLDKKRENPSGLSLIGLAPSPWRSKTSPQPHLNVNDDLP